MHEHDDVHVRTFNDELKITEKDVLLDYLPVGLNWGYITLVQSMLAGAKAVLMERFSAEGALEIIEREKVTYIPTAPASIVAMLNSPDLKSAISVHWRRDHRRRVGGGGNHQGVPGRAAEREADRALRDAGTGFHSSRA